MLFRCGQKTAGVFGGRREQGKDAFMRFATTAAVVTLYLGLMTGSVLGSAENLTIEHYPRVFSTYLPVTYRVATGDLTMGDYTIMDVYTSKTGKVELQSGDCRFYLTAHYNATEGGFDGGSLSIVGDYDDDGKAGGSARTLFESTSLTDYWYGETDLFKFLFSGTVVSPLLVQTGAVDIGVIIDARNLSTGATYDPLKIISAPAFDADFTGDGNAYSNTFSLPEPGTLALVALGAIFLIRRRC